MKNTLPPPIAIRCQGADLHHLLSQEWLLANKIGAYASSSVVGCNTRKYHGLLVAATLPPVGRICALATIMEQLTIGGETYDLATNEFGDVFAPRGMMHLAEFRNDVAPTYVYRIGKVELVKEVILAESANAVAVRYTLRGGAGQLRLWPFAPLRDFHGVRKVHEPHQLTFEAVAGGVAIQDRQKADYVLHVIGQEAKFEAKPQWWYRFIYREEIARGQDGVEDLYTPGSFVYELAEGQSCQITASLGDPVPVGFATTVERRRERLEELSASAGEDADELTRRLAVASDAYVVMRDFPNAPPSPTILAGYHWFADWGRDTFIALPGLLLSTGRYDLARGVFNTFASYMDQGMIANVFDDRSQSAHYNSIDASLWFILAGERYVEATGDTKFWRDMLMPASDAILTAYANGTMFDIHADADGLLCGGRPDTQLTWMDAKLGNEVVTPRQGKAVEVNALWHSAHRVMAQRCRAINPKLADRYEHQAQMIGAAFAKAFWNAEMKCLFDCIDGGRADATLRPNQILAVSLPHSPLTAEQQAGVLRIVTENLLTPMGLRTLSPQDSRYRRGYGGSVESRDRAYHQGTVWAWLMGPYVEAFLKVNGPTPFAIAHAKGCLDKFSEHLLEAGIGQISEIFDGDAPHAPRGCIAQAWSVAEVLRVKKLVAQLGKKA